MAAFVKIGRYRIWQRLKKLRKSLKWLRDEMISRGYDVPAYNHLGEYINGVKHGDRGDKICAVADKIIAEYERNKK